MTSSVRPEDCVPQIAAAISATAKGDWGMSQPDPGDTTQFWTAQSEGWSFLICLVPPDGDRAPDMGGTATRGSTIVHLTDDLLRLARGRLREVFATVRAQQAESDDLRMALANKILKRPKFRRLTVANAANAAVQGWIDESGSQWLGHIKEERRLVKVLNGFLDGAKGVVKDAGSPEAVIANRGNPAAFLSRTAASALSADFHVDGESAEERADRVDRISQLADLDPSSPDAVQKIGDLFTIPEKFRKDRDEATLVKRRAVVDKVFADLRERTVGEGLPSAAGRAAQDWLGATGLWRGFDEEVQAFMDFLGEALRNAERRRDARGSSVGSLDDMHKVRRPTAPGPSLVRDLDKAAELETVRLIDEARAKVAKPIRSIGLEGPGVDEVRHLLDGHGFDTQRFYEKDEQWSRALEPPAWRVRRMHKGETESLIPPEQKHMIAELKARSAPGKMLRAVVIFFLRDGGVDYRVRIPSVQTRSGKWAVLNIYAGEIEELDDLDDMAARVAADSLSANLRDNELALWRTSCAACAASFETGPNLKVRWGEEGQEAFVHPACWNEEHLLLLSAFLEKGVSAPRAQAVTRTTGSLATRMAEEGPYAILKDWENEWQTAFTDEVIRVVSLEIKDRAPTITDPAPSSELAGKGFKMELDEHVLALARDAGVDVEAQITGLVERALAQGNQRKLLDHASNILEQHAAQGHDELAGGLKDLVLALTVSAFDATGVRTDLANARHPLRIELAKAIDGWTSLRGITEDQASAIVDREIKWRNRGHPKCTEWQDECCVCDEALDYGPVVRLETSECHLACYVRDGTEPDTQITPNGLVTGVRFAFTDRGRWDEASHQDRYDMLVLAGATRGFSEMVSAAWDGDGPHGMALEPERTCENWEQVWPGLSKQSKEDADGRKVMDVIKGTSKVWPFDAIWILYGAVYDREVWACMDCLGIDLIRTEDLETLSKGSRLLSGSIKAESWRCARCDPDPEWALAAGTRVRIKRETGEAWGDDCDLVFGPGDVGVVQGPDRMSVMIPEWHHEFGEGEFGKGPYTGDLLVTFPGSNELAEAGRADPLGGGKRWNRHNFKRTRVVWTDKPEDLEVIKTPCTKKAPCWGKLRCRRHGRQAGRRLYGSLDVSAGLARAALENGLTDQEMGAFTTDAVMQNVFLGSEGRGPHLLEKFKSGRDMARRDREMGRYDG